jgi:M6 family metalloprotease-like protein
MISFSVVVRLVVAIFPPCLQMLLATALIAAVTGCAPPLQQWTLYPALPTGATTLDRHWLILKCTVSDDRTARFMPGPPHSSPYDTTAPPPQIKDLDSFIQLFLTIEGVGTGNLTDYYHDVSYGNLSMYGNTVYGWYPAAFASTDALSRPQRVELCAEAALASSDGTVIAQRLASSWGVIMVTNVVLDGGACQGGYGQLPLIIQGTIYNLGCVEFDPMSMFTQFAAHEVGHGLGLPHAFDNTPVNNCSGAPGEYMDAYDVMGGCSPPNTHFIWSNYPGQNGFIGGGPGYSVPTLLWWRVIPIQLVEYLGGPGPAGLTLQSNVTLTALSHPNSAHPGAKLAAVIEEAGSTNDVYTVEYRQNDGWDQAISSSGVLIHEYKIPGPGVTSVTTPFSILQRDPLPDGAWSSGLRQAGDVWQNPQGGTVSVLNIDKTAATATVVITLP